MNWALLFPQFKLCVISVGILSVSQSPNKAISLTAGKSSTMSFNINLSNASFVGANIYLIS